MNTWMHEGLDGNAMADLRMKADKLMCTGEFDAGKLLHRLLNMAQSVGQVESLEEELQDVKTEAKDYERDLDYAKDTVTRVQKRLEEHRESFMHVMDELLDSGTLQAKAFDRLEKELKDGLDDATGPLYDIA